MLVPNNLYEKLQYLEKTQFTDVLVSPLIIVPCNWKVSIRWCMIQWDKLFSTRCLRIVPNTSALT